jgi:heterodisulfide reductase subunit A-like polyferredoxin
MSPKLVEVGRHPNIEIHTLAEVKGLSGEPGCFTASLEKQPRYIDPGKCTGCGECAKVCPVTMADEFNQGLSEWQAVHRLYPQAFPPAFAIKKLDREPCSLTCPAEVNVQGYIQLIRKGEYEEAIKLIMERLPLPGVLGRICPHPCEEQCRRQEVDDPLAICALKRFVADQVDLSAFSPPLVEARPEKIALIGSGPAGLACAYHLALRGYRPTIFEALDKPGGMLRVGIPDYRLPKDILDKEIDNLLRLGVTLETNTALGRDFTLDELFERGFKAVFLGIGCHLGKPLGIPGEDAPGVMQGVEFLKKNNLGESLKIGKRLVVIGGGNVAIDAARTARRLGSEVTIVYRRSQEEMPAFHHEIEQALCEGVEIVYLAAPPEIVTDSSGRVQSLVCQRMELGKSDASGRRRPVPISGDEFELPADMVVAAIGQKAALSPLEACGVSISLEGTIEVDAVTYQTSRPGVFAAGDAHTGPWIAIEALAGGIEAAESIDRYLKGVDLSTGRVKKKAPDAPRWRALPLEKEKRSREVMPALLPEDTCGGFEEIAIGYSESQAQAEAARCLNCGLCAECLQCVAVCQAGAIDHFQQPEAKEVQVGAVILASGLRPHNPGHYLPYHYASFSNVLTSLEFERILSASGPFGGHLVRPSDHQEPRKIAWLQCVGSRDLHPADHSYCSAVCCMYAVKQTLIAREHSQEPLDTAIFFMDMRTSGKDFDKYYQRARDQGVRFIRSRVHSLNQVAGTGQILLRYINEDGRIITETFDLVVLSVGLESTPELVELSRCLGVEVNTHYFARTSPFAPVAASRPGVFVCGTFAGPKDVPQSVTEAAAAAAAAGELLAAARHRLTGQRPAYQERDVTGEEPRLGIFICHCGTNIAGIIDVAALKEYAASLPGVLHAETNLFTCSQDTQKIIKARIKEFGLNRVVVASCSPRTHEAVFQETLREAGLNSYLVEMANIRDQDAWVHQQEPEAAFKKAQDLVRMAVARVATLEPLQKEQFPVTKSALILGGGVAGMEAALSLAHMGFPVYLAEKTDRLGGQAHGLVVSARGYDYQEYLADLMKTVSGHRLIQVEYQSRAQATEGFIGNFRTILATPAGDREIKHGVTILATGGQPYVPTEYAYGQHPGIYLSADLDHALATRDPQVIHADQAVFIQCVGSREPERPYCSRVCCTRSVESALGLKELKPEMDVFILYRDMRTYGVLEDLYQKAREEGIMFIRFDPENKPEVEIAADGSLQVMVLDPILGRRLKLTPDILTLASAILPNQAQGLSELFKVPLNAEGFFQEAHAKLRPVDFSVDGIYVAGWAHYPKPLNEVIVQAKAAAARAATVLARQTVEVEPLVARVNQDLCLGCGFCELACPYGAMRLVQITGKGYRSENIPAYCKGCGVCAAGCPMQAIDMSHFLDRQILATIHAGGRG